MNIKNYFFALPEAIRFLIIGSWNTVFGYGIFAIIYFITEGLLHEQIVLLLSYFISSIQTFITLKYLVFQSNGNWKREYPKCLVVSVTGWAINAAILFVLNLLVNWHILLVQALAVMITAIFNYLAHKNLSFKDFSYSISKPVLCLILIICVGLGIRVYSAMHKAYFFHDEIFTLELQNDSTWAKQRTNVKNYNKLINGKIFLEDVYIENQEKFNYDFNYVLKYDDIHPPLFYWVLHPLQVLFTEGTPSWWPGIILNLFCFVGISIVLFLLSTLIIENKWLALWPVAFFAFSPAMVSVDMLVRMYSLYGLWVVLITYYSVKMLKSHHPSYLFYVQMGTVYLLGALTHYYFICFSAFLFMGSCYLLVKQKSYKKLKAHVLTASLSGCLYLLIWPVAFRQVFCSKLAATIQNYFGFASTSYDLFYMLNYQVFGGLLGIVCVALLILFATQKHNIKPILKQADFHIYWFLMFIVMVLMFLFIFYTQPFSISAGAVRYFYPVNILLLFLLLLLLAKLLFVCVNYNKFKYITIFMFFILPFVIFSLNKVDFLFLDNADEESLVYKLMQQTESLVVIKTRDDFKNGLFEDSQLDWTLVNMMPYLYNKKQVYIIDDNYFNDEKLQQLIQQLNCPKQLYLAAPYDDTIVETFNNVLGVYKAKTSRRYRNIYLYNID